MSYSVTANPAMPAENKIEEMRQELTNFLACVKGNKARLGALTAVEVVDGYSLDNMSCAPLDEATLRIVGAGAVGFLLAGLKADGSRGAWSVGSMGSRWLDMNVTTSEGVKLDYCRIHFYSRKHNGTKAWPTDKPYMVRIIAEKAQR